MDKDSGPFVFNYAGNIELGRLSASARLINRFFSNFSEVNIIEESLELFL